MIRQAILLHPKWKQRRQKQFVVAASVAAAGGCSLIMVRSALQHQQQLKEKSNDYDHRKEDSSIVTKRFFDRQHHYVHDQQKYNHNDSMDMSLLLNMNYTTTQCEEVGSTTNRHQHHSPGETPVEHKNSGRFGFFSSWWKRLKDDQQDVGRTKDKEDGGGNPMQMQRSRTKAMFKEVRQKTHTIEERYDIDWNDFPIGEGAFGVVYGAYDRETGIKVAIKKEPKDVVDCPDFEQEMDALLLLKEKGGHPNICALLDNYETSTSFLIVFDYISGVELFEHLIETGLFSCQSYETSEHIRDVASALAFLHQIGIVHADIKCENIMLSSGSGKRTRRRSNNRRKNKMFVIDFGSAHILSDKSKVCEDGKRKMTSRSLSYCPPEVLRQLKECDDDEDNRRAHIEPSYDMWSLGVVLYIMLVGKLWLCLSFPFSK